MTYELRFLPEVEEDVIAGFIKLTLRDREPERP